MTLLEITGLAKRYGPVTALRGVDLSIEPAEVHALLGANGAGKSTLVKILAGALAPDEGSIRLNARELRLRSPRGARAASLACIFQRPALMSELTIRQNLRLCQIAEAKVSEQLERLGVAVALQARVAEVPLAHARMTEVAAALVADPELLVLDEVTAGLPSDFARRLFDVVRERRAAGRTVLYITHRLAEVTALCDRATVLCDGVDVETVNPAEVSHEAMVAMMIGTEAARVASPVDERLEPRRRRAPFVAVSSEAAPSVRSVAGTRAAEAASDPALLEVHDLAGVGELEGVTFDLRRGEVLGLVALEGQGQDTLFDCLAGVRRSPQGSMRLRGSAYRPRGPYDSVRQGIVLLPGERLQVLLPQRSIRENIAAPRYSRPRWWGPLHVRTERELVQRAIDRLSIDTRAHQQVARLSGGNQQKVALARWLANGFEALLCFDPTRGIDVATKHEVYALLREFAAEHRSTLLFTSELAEVPLVCDRVLVMYAGRIVAEYEGATASEQQLLHSAHGLAAGRSGDAA